MKLRWTQDIIEKLHASGYSDAFIAEAMNWLREQPEGFSTLKSRIQYIIDNEYLINCRLEAKRRTNNSLSQ
jgi:hypothetical protein